MDPQDRRYTREHEWVQVEGATARVGITDHAQHALGDITFVELPQPGRRLKAGEALGVVESVKAASDIFAPVAGVVQEVNPALAGKPELINQDPYGQGWLCRLAEVGPGQSDGLMTAGEYAAHCRQDA